MIALHIADPKEKELPPVGLVQLEDAETNRQVIVDMGHRRTREMFVAAARRRRDDLRRLMRSAQIDLIEVSTDGSHLDSLIRFFQMRERRLRRT